MEGLLITGCWAYDKFFNFGGKIVKRFIVMLMILFFVACTVPVWAGPVDEAKIEIEKVKHEALVTKAKILLNRKEEVERELKEINQKLEKLNNGEDVTSDDDPKTVWATKTSGTISPGYFSTDLR